MRHMVRSKPRVFRRSTAVAIPSLILAALLALSASAVDTTSTTGVRVVTVPFGTDTAGVAMVGDAIALTRITGQSGVWPGSGPLLRIQDDLPAGGGAATIGDMNSNLEVVGSYRIGVEERAYFWSEAKGVVDIPAPLDHVSGSIFNARGISDDGWIVGEYRGEAGACYVNENTCDFLAVPSGASYTVSTLDRPAPFSIFGLNDIELMTSGEHVAVGFGLVWSDATGLPDNGFSLLDAGTATWVDALDINRNGEIVGLSFTTSTSVVQAAYWSSPVAALTDLDPLTVHSRSEAHAINDTGIIVGFSGTSSLEGTAVFWDGLALGPTDLGHIAAGTTYSAAGGISEDGIIVGVSAGDAVIWDVVGDYVVGEVIEIDPIADETVEPETVVDRVFTWSGTPGLVNPQSWLQILGGTPGNPILFGATDSTVNFSWFTPTEPGAHEFTFEVISPYPGVPNATETFTLTVGSSTEPATISINETVAVSDDPTLSLPVLISVTESVGVTDEVAVRLPVLISVTESVGVTDEVAVRLPVLISVTESVGVADEVAVRLPVLIQVTESVGVADEVAVKPPVVISITESVGVADQVDSQSEDPDGDSDSDGIANSVDTDPSTHSTQFSDVPLAGSTFGEIIDSGQQNVGVFDAADNAKGVTIATGNGPPDDYAIVELCTEQQTVHIWANTSATHTCGSLTVDVTEGLITLPTSDGAEIDIGPGSSVILEDDGETVTIEVLIGTALIRLGDLTINLEAGDVVESPGDANFDHDSDGLSTNEETLTGTDPIDPDTDSDDLVDGIDPTWLSDYVVALPNDAFNSSKDRAKLRARLALLHRKVTAGDRDSALDLMSVLEIRTNGCGTEADRNDWIADCEVQAEFNALLALLKRNVATMALPHPRGRWE